MLELGEEAGALDEVEHGGRIALAGPDVPATEQRVGLHLNVARVADPPERVVVGGDGLLEAALLGEERGLLGPRATLHRHLAGLVGEAHRVAERVVGLGESPVQALDLGGEEPGAGLADRVAAASEQVDRLVDGGAGLGRPSLPHAEPREVQVDAGGARDLLAEGRVELVRVGELVAGLLGSAGADQDLAEERVGGRLSLLGVPPELGRDVRRIDPVELVADLLVLADGRAGDAVGAAEVAAVELDLAEAPHRVGLADPHLRSAELQERGLEVRAALVEESLPQGADPVVEMMPSRFQSLVQDALRAVGPTFSVQDTLARPGAAEYPASPEERMRTMAPFLLVACGWSEQRFEVVGIERLCEAASACAGTFDAPTCVDRLRDGDCERLRLQSEGRPRVCRRGRGRRLHRGGRFGISTLAMPESCLGVWACAAWDPVGALAH